MRPGRPHAIVSYISALALAAAIVLVETGVILKPVEPCCEMFVSSSKAVPVKWVAVGRFVCRDGAPAHDLCLASTCGYCGCEVRAPQPWCSHCARTLEWPKENRAEGDTSKRMQESALKTPTVRRR